MNWIAIYVPYGTDPDEIKRVLELAGLGPVNDIKLSDDFKSEIAQLYFVQIPQQNVADALGASNTNRVKLPSSGQRMVIITASPSYSPSASQSVGQINGSTQTGAQGSGTPQTFVRTPGQPLQPQPPAVTQGPGPQAPPQQTQPPAQPPTPPAPQPAPAPQQPGTQNVAPPQGAPTFVRTPPQQQPGQTQPQPQPQGPTPGPGPQAPSPPPGPAPVPPAPQPAPAPAPAPAPPQPPAPPAVTPDGCEVEVDDPPDEAGPQGFYSIPARRKRNGNAEAGVIHIITENTCTIRCAGTEIANQTEFEFNTDASGYCPFLVRLEDGAYMSDLAFSTPGSKPVLKMITRL